MRSCRLSKRGPTALDPTSRWPCEIRCGNGGWVAIEAVSVSRCEPIHAALRGIVRRWCRGGDGAPLAPLLPPCSPDSAPCKRLKSPLLICRKPNS